MKKQIKPEDLHLNEEVVIGNSNVKVEQTRNTCGPMYGCDTTTTDGSVVDCPTETQDCNETEGVCKSLDCPYTYDCFHSESAAEVCCNLSAKGNDCNTTLCHDHPSIDVCPYTDDCPITTECGEISKLCEETVELCNAPVQSVDFDCEVDKG